MIVRNEVLDVTVLYVRVPEYDMIYKWIKWCVILSKGECSEFYY